MDTGEGPDAGLFVATDVHYLASGGARAAAVVSADAIFSLDPDGRPGLGAHAHTEFGVPVVGLAKTAFRTATHAIQVLRGTSSRPLYVTAAGMPRADAAELVRRMTGRHRTPDALRRVDTPPEPARWSIDPARTDQDCSQASRSALIVSA